MYPLPKTLGAVRVIRPAQSPRFTNSPTTATKPTVGPWDTVKSKAPVRVTPRSEFPVRFTNSPTASKPVGRGGYMTSQTRKIDDVPPASPRNVTFRHAQGANKVIDLSGGQNNPTASFTNDNSTADDVTVIEDKNEGEEKSPSATENVARENKNLSGASDEVPGELVSLTSITENVVNMEEVDDQVCTTNDVVSTTENEESVDFTDQDLNVSSVEAATNNEMLEDSDDEDDDL